MTGPSTDDQQSQSDPWQLIPDSDPGQAYQETQLGQPAYQPTQLGQPAYQPTQLGQPAYQQDPYSDPDFQQVPQGAPVPAAQYQAVPQGAPYQVPASPAPGYAQYPAPGYAAAPARSGTATAAGVLALLGVLHMLVLALGTLGTEKPDVDIDVDFSSFDTVLGLQLFGALLIGVLLAVGGILMLLRKQVSRLLISIACGIDIVVWLGLSFWTKSVLNDIEEAADVKFDSSYMAGVTIGILIVLVFPIITVILANVKSTVAWLNSAPQR